MPEQKKESSLKENMNFIIIGIIILIVIAACIISLVILLNGNNNSSDESSRSNDTPPVEQEQEKKELDELFGSLHEDFPQDEVPLFYKNTFEIYESIKYLNYEGFTVIMITDENTVRGDIITFFDTELPKKGWKKTGQTDINADIPSLEFEKSQKAITVQIIDRDILPPARYTLFFTGPDAPDLGF